MSRLTKDLWKSAKVLAAQQERPVKMLVADGLRLLLKQDQASVEPLSHDKYSSLVDGGLAERPASGSDPDSLRRLPQVLND